MELRVRMRADKGRLVDMVASKRNEHGRFMRPVGFLKEVTLGPKKLPPIQQSS